MHRVILPQATALILATLAAAVLAVYAPVWQFGFISGDDGSYVNGRVLEGLTGPGAAWAFRTFESSNWHPLTWLSLMLDAELGGGGPAMFHLTNLILHLAGSWLLFIVLFRMTGRRARSFFVAALFAVHPLHVESVAWVSERKDVLSGLFWMLALLAWTAYRNRPSTRRYLWVVAATALGLMAKPMLVTLPLVLLLLDYWPLRRLRSLRAGLIDKLPLLALAAASSVVTLYAQHAGGAVGTLEKYPFGLRLANALISYARYLVKTFWPAHLAPQYPYDPHPSAWLVAGSALMLAGISFVILRAASARPYLLVGWLWFLGTLVPVIGLVQVGVQSMADRYTYIPSIGLFVMVAWGLPELAGRRTAVLPAAAAVALVALAGAARVQAGYWRDTVTLFTHAVAVAPGNPMAHVNLGVELQRAGNVDRAIDHYRAALDADPDTIQARVDLAAALVQSGRLDAAVDEYRLALERAPGDGEIRANLGVVLLNLKRYAEAERELREALRLHPRQARAWKNLGIAVFRQGRVDEAIEHFAESLRLDPTSEEVRRDLERMRGLKDRLDQRETQRPISSPETTPRVNGS